MGKSPGSGAISEKSGWCTEGRKKGRKLRAKTMDQGILQRREKKKSRDRFVSNRLPASREGPRCAGIQKSLQVIGFAVKKHNLNLLAEIVNSGILPIIIAKSRDSFTFLPVLQAEFPP